MHCSKRIKTLQQQESKEQDVEDGWVQTDNPIQTGDKPGGSDAVDIDDYQNIDAEEEQQEAVDIDIDDPDS